MQTIAGYTLLGRLGSGTSGTVWKAHDDALDRVVAIKALDAPSAESRAQWRSEAQVLAALDDPHLVAVYGYAENAEGAYIIEEWVDGAPLTAVLSAGPLSAAQALGVIRGALLGLAHVHARGLVHGDIAPANILFDTAGSSKLVDFGLSSYAGATSASSGTTAYASPEAQRGQPVTAPSDVYAAAAVLAYLLRGRAAVTPVLDGVDAALRPVLRRALDADPARRYPDAAAFLAALEEDATRRYGMTWWTQTGLAALVAAAPATVLIEGSGTAAVAGHGAATLPAGPPHPGTEQLLQPAHPATFDAARQTDSVSDPSPPSAPPDSAAANWRTRRPRLFRAPVIAAAAAVVVLATAAAVYAATRPSHHNAKHSPAAGPSIPGGTSSLPISSAASAPTTGVASGSSGGSSIAGTWAATSISELVAGFQAHFTVVFAVDGSTVTGTITIASGCIRDGTISGTITGPSLDFGKVAAASGAGAVAFQGTVSGDAMSGKYETNAACGNDKGTWQAVRVLCYSAVMCAGGSSGTSTSAFGSPRKVNLRGPSLTIGSSGSVSTTTMLPADSSPKRIFSDNASSISRWMVRRNGRAPSTGS